MKAQSRLSVAMLAENMLSNWMYIRKLLPALMAASLGYFVVQTDVSIVNLSLPSIQAYYHTSVSMLQWIVNAYTLSLSVLLLSAGVLGDHYGTKRFLIIGYIVFFVGSFACAIAPSIPFLLASRFFQGIGAAIIIPNSLAVINSTFAHDNRLRVLMITIWMAFGGVALSAGPIFGGIITSIASWRYIFVINLPICLIGTLLVWRYVNVSLSCHVGRRHDWLGQALILFFATSLLLLIINYDDLTNITRWTLFGAAITSLVLFVITEIKHVDPAIPLVIFRNTGLRRAVTLGFLVNFIYFGIIFFLSLYFRYNLHMTPLQAGLAFIPVTFPLIISNIWSAKITRRHYPEMSIMIGLLVLISGMFYLSLLSEKGTSYLEMFPALAFVSCGVGLVTPMITTIAMHSIGHERGGMISGVINFSRQVGGTFGVAVFGGFLSSSENVAHYDIFSDALLVIAFVMIGFVWWFRHTSKQLYASRG
ncbi:MAG: MFS transporter [Acidithiobacillus sp.]|jgi:DHA2 family methylenomycin A resistance protein-like MFS transporter|nr:MFS transporter [Acidithiobacillus sp.]MCE5388543.1 MFS transporter [Acidithiobacillus sp.]